jgi:predicted MFS family arabinose efflux permease
VTVTGGLLALVFGITSGGNEGWGRPWVIAAIAAGVVLLAAFWQVESRSAHPLAPLHVLRRRTVGWGNFGGFAVFAMESSVVFLLTLYLQDVLGYSSLVTGLVFAAPGAAAVASGVLAPRLMGRYGSRVSLVAGLTLMAMSTLAMTQIGLGRADAIWVMVAAAVGFFAHVHGIVAYITTVTGGLPDSAQGLATGLTTMTQLVAITVGTPVFATIATARSAAPASTAGTAVATLDGLRLALAVDGIATLVITAVIALALLRRGPRDEARAGAGA